MAELLFRQEVIEAGRQRLAGTVIAAVPPSSRVYTALLLAVVAAAGLLLAFGQYATSAEVRGVVAFDAGIARVFPSTAADIRQIHVRPGQRVAAGAPLVTLGLAQGENGLLPQIEQNSQQDGELARQSDLAGSLAAAETRGLEQQRSSLQAMIGSLERQRALASGQVSLAEAAANRAARLAREGAGTQRQVEDGRAALLTRRAEVESLSERLIVQREALRTVTAQIAQKGLETSRSQSVLAAQRAALAEQRAELSRANQIVVTAPVAGEVSDIAMEVGQRAQTDRSLVSIVPADSRLEIWLYAPSRAVGFARPGQEVRLRFDAFPHQRYGAGQGQVMEVSRVAADPASLGAELGISEPVFRLRVRIDALPRGAADAGTALRPGMTVSARLVQERRSLWEWFFNPIAGAFGS